MTIYYMDEAAGSDANTGLSWGQARKSLGSVTGLAMTGGDELRIAKNTTEVTDGHTGSVVINEHRITLNSSVSTLLFHAPAVTTGWTVYNAAALNSGLTGTQPNMVGFSSYMLGFTKAAPAASTKYAAIAITSINLSAYQELQGWVAFEALTITADPNSRWRICLCSDTIGDVIVDDFIITVPYRGGQNASNVTPFKATRVGGGNFGTAIQSIAIYSTATPTTAAGTPEFHFGMLHACPTNPAIGVDDWIWNSQTQLWAKIVMIDNNIGGTAGAPKVYLHNGGLTASAGGEAFTATASGLTIKIAKPGRHPYSFFSQLSGNGVGVNTNYYINAGGVSTSNRLLISGGWDTGTGLQTGLFTFDFGPPCYAEGAWGGSGVCLAVNTGANFITFSNIWFTGGYQVLQKTVSGYLEWDVKFTDCIFYASSAYWAITYLRPASTEYVNCQITHNSRCSSTSISGSTIGVKLIFDNTKYTMLVDRYLGAAGNTGSSLTLKNNSSVRTLAGVNFSFIMEGVDIVSAQAVIDQQAGSVLRAGIGIGTTSSLSKGLAVVTRLDMEDGVFQSYVYVQTSNLTVRFATSGSNYVFIEPRFPYEMLPPTMTGVVIQNPTATCNLGYCNMDGASFTANNGGVRIYNIRGSNLNSCTFTHSNTGNAAYYGEILSTGGANEFNACSFDRVAYAGGSTTGGFQEVKFRGCTFIGMPAGNWNVKEPASGSYIPANSVFTNCTFAQGVAFTKTLSRQGIFGTFFRNAFTRFINYNNVAGDNRAITPRGTWVTDVSTVHTAGGKSWKYTPDSGQVIKNNQPRYSIARVAVLANIPFTAHLWVYQITSANCQILFQAEAGQLEVAQGKLSTSTAANGAWVELTLNYTSSRAGVIEFHACVIQNGSAGDCFFDDFSVSQ